VSTSRTVHRYPGGNRVLERLQFYLLHLALGEVATRDFGVAEIGSRR